ncbi:MAG: ABC transporter permease [bacterium]|nr:ABC transporter permease [bacterium]
MAQDLEMQTRPPEDLLLPPKITGLRLFLWRFQNAEELRWLRVAALRIVFGICTIALWEYVSGRWIDEKVISAPSLLFESFFDIVDANNPDGSLWVHFAYTVENTFWGYIFGAIAGIAFGFLLAELEIVALVIEPFIMAFNGVPRIAYAPLFIAWFGIERQPKIILVLTIVFFLTFVSTFSGIRSVSRDLINVARVLGGNKLAILRKVVLPAASPWIFNGLKISIPFGMVGAIVGEYIIADKGLGYLLQRYNNEYFTTGLILIILILMILVVVINQVLNWSEGRVLRWRPSGDVGQETSIPG